MMHAPSTTLFILHADVCRLTHSASKLSLCSQRRRPCMHALAPSHGCSTRTHAQWCASCAVTQTFAALRGKQAPQATFAALSGTAHCTLPVLLRTAGLAITSCPPCASHSLCSASLSLAPPFPQCSSAPHLEPLPPHHSPALHTSLLSCSSSGASPPSPRARPGHFTLGVLHLSLATPHLVPLHPHHAPALRASLLSCSSRITRSAGLWQPCARPGYLLLLPELHQTGTTTGPCMLHDTHGLFRRSQAQPLHPIHARARSPARKAEPARAAARLAAGFLCSRQAARQAAAHYPQGHHFAFKGT